MITRPGPITMKTFRLMQAFTGLHEWLVAVERSQRVRRFGMRLLTIMMVTVASGMIWHTRAAKPEENAPPNPLQMLEASLRVGSFNYMELGKVINEVAAFQNRARELQKSILYQLGARSLEQDFIVQQINNLMADFGAEQCSIPPEFVAQVNVFIRQYQDSDREPMARALGPERKNFERVRTILKENNLPPDLAFMAVVESDFLVHPVSRGGAAGPWQFTEESARDWGMTVSDQVDERFNLIKSTRGASRYIKSLILDFGSGSSVMLALAAYNSGPERVRNAFKSVQDPIKQRNFWHLYQVRALPPETRQYVPKVIAAIIVGRNPQHFGFGK